MPVSVGIVPFVPKVGLYVTISLSAVLENGLPRHLSPPGPVTQTYYRSFKGGRPSKGEDKTGEATLLMAAPLNCQVFRQVTNVTWQGGSPQEAPRKNGVVKAYNYTSI